MKPLVLDETGLVTLAETIAKRIRGGEVLNLRGDVGAGKTTFTRALARSLGVTDPVQSPTFTIANHYDTPAGIHLGHYDFYRLDDPGIMREELAETLADPHAVIVIEWGEVIDDLIKNDHLDLTLTPVDETTRHVDISAFGKAAEQLIMGLE